jgi:perosamine synthetase
MRFSKSLVACEIGPNYSYQQGIKAIGQMFQLPFTYNQNHTTKLSSYFSQSRYFVDSGRTALYLLLKSLDLPKKSEVLIQGFSCVVVPNSVWQAGLNPVLVDINQENYNISIQDCNKKLTEKTRVLIIQYPFGFVPDLDEVVNFCHKHDIILIEDCAHSFGASGLLKNKNVQVGTIGYGAIFSFGRDKVISSTVGGVAVLNTPTVKNKKIMEMEYHKLNQMNFQKQLQSLIYISLSSLIIRPFYHFGIGKLVLVIAKKLNIIGNIYNPLEKKGTSKILSTSTFPLSLGKMLTNQIEGFEATKRHRKTIAKIYCKALGIEFHENYSHVRFPFVCQSTKEYEEILIESKKQGVILGRWYNSVFIPQDVDLTKFDYQLGDLPVCEELINKKILNLPTNIHVTKNQAKNLIQILISVRNRQLLEDKEQTKKMVIQPQNSSKKQQQQVK